MLVSCPKCSSRYQLADDKIRPTGTKVRCPRCQNTFKVFKKEEEVVDEDSDKTELFMRRDAVSKQSEATVTKRGPAKVEQPVAQQRTEIQPQSSAASAPHTVRDAKPKEPSPFKKNPAVVADLDFGEAGTRTSGPLPESYGEDEETPRPIERSQSSKPFARDPAKVEKARLFEPADEMDSQDAPAATPKDEPSESSEPRPFGDATFLAIQKMGSGKKSRKKVFMGIAAAAAVVAAFFLLTRAPQGPTSTSQTADSTSKVSDKSKDVATVRISRPSKWYQDDPQVFQRLLAQMASQPSADQIEPKARGLIAEALVLNGHYTGNYDQVAQGVGFGSGLLISNPGEVYGFYALAASALFKEDANTLSSLVEKWPPAQQLDFEYRVSKAYLLGREAATRPQALDMIESLLAEFPNHARLQLVALSVSLDAVPDAQKRLGDKTIQELVKSFAKIKESAQIGPNQASPDLIASIDRRLQRRGSLIAQGAPKEKDKEKEKAAPQVAEAPKTLTKSAEDSATQRLNQRQQARLMEQGRQKAPETPTKVAAPEVTAQADATSATAPASPTPSPTAAAPAPAPTAQAKASPKPAPNRLPKQSEQLVALNKQEQREESEASKLYKQALGLMKQEKTEEAIMMFQKSLRFDPDFADSYKQLGEIYMKRSDKERALRSFKIYLQLKPDGSDKQVVEGWISSLQ